MRSRSTKSFVLGMTADDGQHQDRALDRRPSATTFGPPCGRRRSRGPHHVGGASPHSVCDIFAQGFYLSRAASRRAAHVVAPHPPIDRRCTSDSRSRPTDWIRPEPRGPARSQACAPAARRNAARSSRPRGTMVVTISLVGTGSLRRGLRARWRTCFGITRATRGGRPAADDLTPRPG